MSFVNIEVGTFLIFFMILYGFRSSILAKLCQDSKLTWQDAKERCLLSQI